MDFGRSLTKRFDNPFEPLADAKVAVHALVLWINLIFA
jgi:hypothetical protein